MAETIKIKRLSREDFKEAPGWIERLLGWLNQFVEFVTLAFNGNITFEQNIQCQIKNFELVAGASADLCTAQFKNTMRVAPKQIFLGKAVQRSGNFITLTSPVSLNSWRYENGTIYIMSISGLTNGAIYDLSVLII